MCARFYNFMLRLFVVIKIVCFYVSCSAVVVWSCCIFFLSYLRLSVFVGNICLIIVNYLNGSDA